MSNGEIRLEIKRDAREDRSVLSKQYYKLPLQIMKPFYQRNDEAVYCYLLNPSGGILDYDDLYVKTVVHHDASACLLTPSATKIYMKRQSAVGACQKNIFNVADYASLEYYPEEIIPYAESSFAQRTQFNLCSSSSLIACEIISAGRVSRNEIFDFRKYESYTEITIEGRLIACDHSLIEPDQMDIDGMLCMGGYLYHGIIYVYGDFSEESAGEYIDSVSADNSDLLTGHTCVDSKMMIIRILSRKATDVKKAVRGISDFFRHDMLGKAPMIVRSR